MEVTPPPIDMSKLLAVYSPDALVTLTLRALIAKSFVAIGWIVVGKLKIILY